LSYIALRKPSGESTEMCFENLIVSRFCAVIQRNKMRTWKTKRNASWIKHKKRVLLLIRKTNT